MYNINFVKTHKKVDGKLKKGGFFSELHIYYVITEAPAPLNDVSQGARLFFGENYDT